MSKEQEGLPSDPRMECAVSELAGRISDKYPGASFALQQGIDDPEQTWLVATVDIEDPDEVVDLVIDRLLVLQIDEQVPLHVLPVHTPERVAQTLRHQHRAPVPRLAERHGRPPQH